jgi:hypothetical protein
MQPTCDPLDTAGISAMQVVRPSGHSPLTNPRLSKSSRHLWPETVTLPRLLLAITLAFLILSSAALSQPAARPETGYYIRDIDRSGYGQLIIHNDWTMDTVAVLTDMDAKPLVAAYLRSKDTLNITEIEEKLLTSRLKPSDQEAVQERPGYYRYNPIFGPRRPKKLISVWADSTSQGLNSCRPLRLPRPPF